MAAPKREARLRADVPAIHVFCLTKKEDVDARHKAGHDGNRVRRMGAYPVAAALVSAERLASSDCNVVSVE